MIIRLILAGLSVFFGIRLLFANETIRDLYTSWGLPVELQLFAGAGQIVAAGLLFYKPARLTALLFFWSLISVALVTHYRVSNEWFHFVPGFIVALLTFVELRQLRQSSD